MDEHQPGGLDERQQLCGAGLATLAVDLGAVTGPHGVQPPGAALRPAGGRGGLGRGLHGQQRGSQALLGVGDPVGNLGLAPLERREAYANVVQAGALLELGEARREVEELGVELRIADRAVGERLRGRLEVLERGGESLDALLRGRVGHGLLRELLEHPRELVETALGGGIGQRAGRELGKRSLELLERIGVAGHALYRGAENVHAVDELGEADRERVNLGADRRIARRALAQRLDDGLQVLDLADEVRIAIEERAAFSPDALTGMEASLRFAGPETIESKIFARLSAWQNWIFQRPNAVGPRGALQVYGTGQRGEFDRRRV